MRESPLGSWGRDILAALGRMPGARVEAICDAYEPFLKRSTQAAARAATVTDYRRLLEASPVKAVVVDPDRRTVRFRRPGMRIDFGAIGKGYAIDAAIEILRSHHIQSALLHGGTSSLHAIGAPDDSDAWHIGWTCRAGETRTFKLRDAALSVSAVHGKAFEMGGQVLGHVLDPRTGAPTMAARAAVVTGPRSLECDGLSTALLVLGPSWLDEFKRRFPPYSAIVV